MRVRLRRGVFFRSSSDKLAVLRREHVKLLGVAGARINDSAKTARRLARPLVRAPECDLDYVTRVRRARE
jgi:hypothetical protein